MHFARDGLRLHLNVLASELFDLPPDHERAEELRERILALMRLARANAEARAANAARSRSDDQSL
jgi:hypothetical protein